ncbi:MAG TPA: hypothetical protein VF230_11535 [Acidimicrobiales bacterium]
MDRLADVTFGDVFRALGRYVPVGVTVLVVLLVVALSPGPRYKRVGPEQAAPAQFTPFRPAGGGATAPTTTIAPAPDVASGPLPGFDTGVGSFGSGSGVGSFDTVDPSTTFTGNEDSVAPDTAFEPTPESEIGFEDPGDESTPSTLAIIGSAWATATPGLPAQATGVPAGTLPVGRRVGRDDKISYVRLAGEADVLRIVEDATGTRAPVGTGVAAVRVCPVTTENWTDGEGKAIGEINFAETGCVTGLREPDGTWVFDMSSFSPEQRNARNGFALAPTSDSAIDFQVTFRK